VTVGKQGDLVAAQIGLLDKLQAAHPKLRSAHHGLELLRHVLEERRCLLVIGDVWSVAASVACNDGTVGLWDLAASQPAATFKGRTQRG
jgi:hypothetical protein